MKATTKKLSLNTNTRNELSDLNLNCVNTCTHTKLTLNRHIKDTLTDTAKGRMQTISYAITTTLISNAITMPSAGKSCLTLAAIKNTNAHVALPGPVPDLEGVWHTCVRPVVVFHRRGREEWVVTRGPGALKRLFSCVEFHVVVQGPFLCETSIT